MEASLSFELREKQAASSCRPCTGDRREQEPRARNCKTRSAVPVMHRS